MATYSHLTYQVLIEQESAGRISNSTMRKNSSAAARPSAAVTASPPATRHRYRTMRGSGLG